MTVLKYKEFVNESLNEKSNYTMAKIDKWLKKNATKATGGGVWGPGYDYELKDGNKVAIMDLGMKVNIEDKDEKTISFAEFQREYM